MDLEGILNKLVKGEKSIERVKNTLLGMEDEGFKDVVVDLGREARCGLPEVVYGKTKTAEQILVAAKVILEHSGKVLITQVDNVKATEVIPMLSGCIYCERSKAIYKLPREKIRGEVLILGAGTSDMSVAEEAAITCRMFGIEVNVVLDVGVAGLHRLLARRESLQSADCIVVCAGMEGALPSVVGGLVKVPVIAVPVSSGYGSSLGGMSALLGMLNSCASGVTVVNIDNGFGAGYAAGRIILAAQVLEKKK